MKGKGLTKKQKRFIEEYLVDFNATQAAIRSRYSSQTAQTQGSRLLTNVMVKAELERRQKEIQKRLDISQERVLNEYAKIGFSNMVDYVKWNKGAINIIDSSSLTNDQTAAICEITETRSKDSGVTVKFKLHDKKGALDSIARHLGMFKDSLNLTTPVDVNDARSKLAEKFSKGKNTPGN